MEESATSNSESGIGNPMIPSRRQSVSGGNELAGCAGMDRAGAELLAKFLALVQVTQQGLGQEGLRGLVAGPLELVVAPRHVFDQVFHPEQRVTPISHREVLLHSP
jgi:hypothetical protein